MKRSFRREIAELDAIFSFVREYLHSSGVPEAEPFAVDLVLEELFTNMVKYSPEGKESIEIELQRAGDRIRISLVDRGVRAYDITKAKPVDVDAPLSERRIGGLGLHFVREVSDELSYTHEGGVSTITLAMPWGEDEGKAGS